MRNFISKHWLIFPVLLLAAFLRLYKLDQVPPSLNWDEAALGYNAYSIIKTGKDEYGKVLPLVFQSFGDFKPGVYVYLTVPFVILFGLSEIAVRLPSAIFGVLTVALIYFLVMELLENKRVALIASIFLAVSPWHLLLSRPAFEANVALFFNLAAIFCFIKFTKGQLIYLYLSSFAFIISLYTYQGSKLIVPLIVIAFVIVWFERIKKLSLKALLISLTILMFAIPVYFGSLFGGQGGRLEVFSVFSYPQTLREINRLRLEDGFENNSLKFSLFHSQPYYFGRIITYHYLNHFSFRFLFFEGDWQNLRTSIPNSGMMYLFDLVFILFGFFVFLTKKLTRSNFFLLFWLAISPLPAVLTRDLIAPIRAANLIIPLIIFSSLGFDFLMLKIKKATKYHLVLTLVFLLFMVGNLGFVLDSYFNHYPKLVSRDWLYGHKQAVEFIRDNYPKFNRVIFTTSYNEPYIFTLFYNRYPPQNFQPQAKLESVRGKSDVGEITSYDKYLFRPIYWPNDRDLKNTIIIGTEQELPDSDLDRDIKLNKAELLSEIKFLNNDTAFKIVATKND